jgi:hypothetical protein
MMAAHMLTYIYNKFYHLQRCIYRNNKLTIHFQMKIIPVKKGNLNVILWNHLLKKLLNSILIK